MEGEPTNYKTAAAASKGIYSCENKFKSVEWSNTRFPVSVEQCEELVRAAPLLCASSGIARNYSEIPKCERKTYVQNRQRNRQPYDSSFFCCVCLFNL